MKGLAFVADFETTSYEGQEDTKVWLWGITEVGNLDKNKVVVGEKISDFFKYIFEKDKRDNLYIYFHNLKFDGSFLLNYLLSSGYKMAVNNNVMKNKKQLEEKEIIAIITVKGQWYSITIRDGKRIIEFRDSLKLLPFSVNVIGKTFDTKYKKIMDFDYTRKGDEKVEEKDIDYIQNDVLVMSEALEHVFSEGNTKLTIGSNALSEFRKVVGEDKYDYYFPTLNKELDKAVRKSYKGGWTYCNPSFQSKTLYNGCTFDVNSLYPYVMSSDSGCRYPYGLPKIMNTFPQDKNCYFFIKLKCHLDLKEGYLPFLQIRNDVRYNKKEHVIRTLRDSNLLDDRVTLTLTMTDYKLLKEHYKFSKEKIIKFYVFKSKIGLFDEYIKKYKKIKENNKGAKRQLAKLYLNSLYGKISSGDDSSFKVPYLKEGVLKYRDVKENNKDSVYIPCGSAITSYARNLTIRAAQKNYKNFCYADTDSIHCCCPPHEVKGIEIHPSKFGAWDLEGEWNRAIFLRAKSYIEEVNNGDILVTCAGLPSRAKVNIISDLKNGKMELTDFKVGLEVEGKLAGKQIKGGMVLKEFDFILRE